MLPHHIDSTMISCFRSCPRKFQIQFVQGLRPYATSVDLHAGGCFASALENFYRSYYRARQNGIDEGLAYHDAIGIAFRTFTHQWGDFETSKPTSKTKENVWHAINAYLIKYPPATDHVQPLFDLPMKIESPFEFTFAIPLLPEDGFPVHPADQTPFLYCGRFDMLGTYHGRPCIVDQKTSGRSVSANWSDQWTLRNQFMGYCWACQVSGLKVHHALIRGIHILKTKIDFTEAPKFYPEHLILKWEEQLRRDLQRIVQCFREDYWDYDFAETCTAYGLCPYMNLCQSEDPSQWTADYVERRWNPLAKNPIALPNPLQNQKESIPSC